MKKEGKGIIIVNNSGKKSLEDNLAEEDFSIIEDAFSELNTNSTGKSVDNINKVDEKKDFKEDKEIEKGIEVEEIYSPKFVSNSEIFRIVFSRKTLYHVLVLFMFLIFFGVLSYFESDLAVEIIIVFGYGVSIGYFFTAVLNRFEGVRNLSRSERATSLIMPLTLSFLVSGFIWIILHNSTYGNNLERILKLGFIFIFILWQFAQAWWMRIPFKEFALRRMNSYSSEGKSNLGVFGNLFAPILWSLIGLLFFFFISNYVPSFSEHFNQMFILSWILFMSLMGFVSFYFLRKMHNILWSNPKVASFSAYFAIGYWGFLAYHAGILLYSMFNEPSFVYDLFFMIFTIMLIIYSLSVQTLRTEARRNHLKDITNDTSKSSGFMSKHNVIFYSISFTVAYGASSFFLANDASFIGNVKNVSRISHLIVIFSGILVLLLVNHNLLTGRGLIPKGFIESMRTPKDN